MRLRITRSLSGSIDGIHLDDFVVGCVYEVGTSLGSYLLADGAAVPVDDAPDEALTPRQHIYMNAEKPTRMRIDLLGMAAERRKKEPSSDPSS